MEGEADAKPDGAAARPQADQKLLKRFLLIHIEEIQVAFQFFTIGRFYNNSSVLKFNMRFCLHTNCLAAKGDCQLRRHDLEQQIRNLF